MDEKKEIMVPIKEYRKEIRKTERLKLLLAAMTEEKEKFRHWWLEERDKTEELEKKVAELSIEELNNDGND